MNLTWIFRSAALVTVSLAACISRTLTNTRTRTQTIADTRTGTTIRNRSSIEMEGTCDSDADVAERIGEAVSNLCGDRPWVETNRAENSYRCIDGTFRSLIEGYCHPSLFP